MDAKLHKYYHQANSLLQDLCNEKGFMASAIQSDNYKRVWARDSIICGIAGVLTQNESLILGLRNSLLTLARHQHEVGMIPSNVLEAKKDAEVSFGSLVGRTDSNCWFIIGSCLYYNSQKDAATWAELSPVVNNCFRFLKSVEYNGRGWLYTPLSGNWADEYPVQGYTLYDNALYFWAKSCFSKINPDFSFDPETIANTYKANFWPENQSDNSLKHHREAFDEAAKQEQEHLCCYILPGKYDTRFDCAGHGIALLNWQLTPLQKKNLNSFLLNFSHQIGSVLPPAFWPVITQEDSDWEYLKFNFSYAFKNHPYHFHNGGIWPVWLGWICLGLANQGLRDTALEIVKAFLELLPEDGWGFNEYYRSDTLKPSGKLKMGFSASGIIFMKHAIDDNFDKSLLML